MKFLTSNQIQVDVPKKPKKITGTRFGAVLGVNAWATPFSVWCECTRTYEKPYEETKYTLAGKAIEPLQRKYLQDELFFYGLKGPQDIYGDDPMKATWGDFFHDEPIFGGMWDAVQYDESGKPIAVVEFKTTKNAQDWTNGEMPEYYALQVALYAYLMHVDQCYLVASFLEESDYEHPEKFVPSQSNTHMIPFKVSERYPNFEELLTKARKFWDENVATGLSPQFDSTRKVDKEILDILRSTNVTPDTDSAKLIQEYEENQIAIDAAEATVQAKKDRNLNIASQLSEMLKASMKEGDKKATLSGSRFQFVYSLVNSSSIDKEKLKMDGVLDRYQISKEVWKLNVKAIKEDK